MSISVAVIGGGVMGSGLALDLACHGVDVMLKDVSDLSLELALKRIKQDFLMAKLFNKELADLSLDNVLTAIRFTSSYEGIEQATVIIESINEDYDDKAEVYRELDGEVLEDAIIASNTSCISITRLASTLANPSRFIGAHFLNPVPLKKTVEVIKGIHTSEETIERLGSLLTLLNKKPIIVNDSPGFVTNRLSHLFMNEAAFLVQEKIADPKGIDQLFKEGYGHKMGPLETADLIGLDTVIDSLNILYESYQDPKFRCCPLLQKMVHAGLLGKKSGQGFYKYKGGRTNDG